jgi:uncharacterized protein (DUF2062 family)
VPLFIGLAITAIFAAAASYLLISRVWIWHVAAKRRGVLAKHDENRMPTDAQYAIDEAKKSAPKYKTNQT